MRFPFLNLTVVRLLQFLKEPDETTVRFLGNAIDWRLDPANASVPNVVTESGRVMV